MDGKNHPRGVKLRINIFERRLMLNINDSNDFYLEEYDINLALNFRKNFTLLRLN